MKKHKLTFSDYSPFIEDLIERELSERGFSISSKAVYSEEPMPHFDITIELSLVQSILKNISRETVDKKINALTDKMYNVCKHCSFHVVDKWYYTFSFHNGEKEKLMTFLYVPSTEKMSLVED